MGFRAKLGLRLTTAVAMTLMVAGCGAASPPATQTAVSSSAVAPSPTPGFAEPSTVPFAKSDELHKSLAALSTASGKIQGTLVEGGTTSSLSGTVAFKGASSSIDLAEGGAIKSHRDEIVAGGNRYLKLDEGPWVNHGSRANDTGLSTLLKAAATDADQGVEPTFRTGLHRIVTLANTVDVPAALGLDTWNWTDLRSSLRVWSDDAGTVRGFGASIVWTQPVIGVATGFSMEIDVPFDASPKVSIAAPKGAWKWILDSGQKIALALP